MILQALYNYYEAMNKLQLIAPPGREYKEMCIRDRVRPSASLAEGRLRSRTTQATQ